MCYLHGADGALRNYEKALEFFLRSAEEDDNEFAQTMCGDFYQLNPELTGKCTEYVLKAANKGNKRAQELCSPVYEASRLLSGETSLTFLRKSENQ